MRVLRRLGRRGGKLCYCGRDWPAGRLVFAGDMHAASQQTTTKPAAAASLGRPRLVCAISADERRLFLGESLAMLEALPAHVTWFEAGADGAERLRELEPEVVLTGWSTARLDDDWAGAPNSSLRYVCHLAGSVRPVVPRGFLERGGLVTNWGDIPSHAVAEQALLLALAALRNFSGWPAVIQRREEAGSHIERLNTRTLFGRSVGLHGFGRVARALVPLLRPFGVSLHAHSVGVPDAMMQAAGVTPCGSIEQLCARSEVLFECEALTPATTGSITAKALAALPDGAVFVNVGRGGLVDEAALYQEAASGRIRAALDVVVSEPLVPNSAFCSVRDAVLSPHIAGPTFDQYPKIGEHAVRNIHRYLVGETPSSVVTLEEYDRAT
jgi:phosphoglycerate dehydrogenase-like enzyme